MMGGSQRFTLNHSERLKFRKQIETLFLTGEAFSVYPFRVVYSAANPRAEKDAPIRTGFSVPKKKMRHAHERNRIKRLLKEAWRREQHTLFPLLPETQQLHLFFIFVGREMPDWTSTQKAVHKITGQLSQKITPSCPQQQQK
jgi:ribonuclease P protein component